MQNMFVVREYMCKKQYIGANGSTFLDNNKMNLSLGICVKLHGQGHLIISAVRRVCSVVSHTRKST